MRTLALPGRSVARSLNGMAATSHALATLTDLDVLRAGGNAMDAAVAAGAVQSGDEPESTRIGGDGFEPDAPRGSTDMGAINGPAAAPARAPRPWGSGQTGST